MGTSVGCGDLEEMPPCRTSTFVWLLTLQSNGGKADEEDEHANDDTKVAPQVASRIAESGFGIVGCRHSKRPGSTALDRAGLVPLFCAGYARGNVRWCTLDFQIVEFVDQEALETILKGIDPS